MCLAIAAFLVSGCATLFGPASEPGDQSTAARAESAEAVPTGETEDSWRTLAAGDQAAVRVPVARPVSDPGTWIDAWSAIHANKSDPPARPDIDFLEETAVIILLGQRPTGGYAVSVVDVTVTQNLAVVEIQITEPAADSVVTQALTSPYVIIAIPGTSRQVEVTGDDIAAGYVGE